MGCPRWTPAVRTPRPHPGSAWPQRTAQAAAGVHCRSRPEALPGHSTVGDPSPCPVMAVAVSAADSAVQRVRTHRPAPAAWPDSAAACVRCHGRPPARPSVEQAPPCLDTRSARRTPKAADGQSVDRSGSLQLSLHPQGRPCGRPAAALRPGSHTTVTGVPASPTSQARTVATVAALVDPQWPTTLPSHARSSRSVAEPLLDPAARQY